MVQILKTMGWILLFTVLYYAVVAMVGLGFLTLPLPEPPHAHMLRLAIGYWFLASPLVLGFLIGYLAARCASGGALMGMATGMACVGVGFLLRLWRASTLDASIPVYIPLAYALGTVVACTIGGYTQSWRAKRRMAKEAIETNEGGYHSAESQ